MNRNSKELKRLSRQALLGNYGLVILALFLMQVITSLLTSPFETQMNGYVQTISQLQSTGNASISVSPGSFPVGSSIATLIISLIMTIMVAGEMRIHLELARGNKLPISTLFGEFKNRPDRYIVLTLLKALVTVACMVPAVILIVILAVGLLPNQQEVLFVAALSIIILLSFVFIIFFELRFSLAVFYLLDDSSLSAMNAMKESFHTMKGHCGRLLYIAFSFIPMVLLTLLSFGIANFWVSPYIYQVQATFYTDVTGEIDRKIDEARRMDEEMGPVLSDESFTL